MRNRTPVIGALSLAAAMVVGSEDAHGQSPQVPAAPPWRFDVTNTTRLEAWRFFEPPPSGGDPDYQFLANRLRIGVARLWPRGDVNAALQYVQFGGLPTGASGPGPLGTGALYYDHGGRTTSRGLYVKELSARVRLPGAVTLQTGRFAYQSGAESASGRPRIELVKRQRVDGRLIGEFEWSIFQRSFDGVRADVDGRRWHLAGAWFSPTQGGFEDDAGRWMPGVDVKAVTFTAKPSAVLPATDVGLFVYRYDDNRRVTARPDNTGEPADRADVHVTTIGSAVVGSASAGKGEADWLMWLAGQTGSWYAQSHRAWSLALEGGYQWKTRWQPWIRGGILHASGDSDRLDARHGTFFPMLPTVRKYAFTASYAPMNLRDGFVEVIVRPTGRLVARADVRRLGLVHAADLWYAGSGALQQRGRSFGYSGRPSGGATDLGTAIESAADVTINPHWSVNGFVGAIQGGRVVRATFPGDRLLFAYLETVLRF